MRNCLSALLLITFICIIFPTIAKATILYKRYIVITDQGQDFLCEPYIVRKNDYVFKLLKQKGEISYKDFPLFIQIFKRINPQLTNIDTILVNQRIFIPLRRISINEYPGQDSGIVDIPLIMISSVFDMVDKYSTTYEIQNGDTISKLICNSFGIDAYEQGIKLFEFINPEIKNLNRVFPGQKVKIPQYDMRNTNWYASIFDAEGNIVKTNNIEQKPVNEHIAAPLPEKNEQSTTTLNFAAKIFNGYSMNSGYYYFPSNSKNNLQDKPFQIDLSKHPVLKFNNNYRVIYNVDNSLPEDLKKTILAYWPKSIFTDINPDSASFNELMNDLHQKINKSFPVHDRCSKQIIYFKDPTGVGFTLQPQWIFNDFKQSGISQRKICVSQLSSPSQETDPNIKQYLEKQGIIINDIFNKKILNSQILKERNNYKITYLDRTNPKIFLKELSTLLGFSYYNNVKFRFSYYNDTITTNIDLVEVKNSADLIIDFGNLYGNVEKLIESKNLQLLNINTSDKITSILERFLIALHIDYKGNPVFPASSNNNNNHYISISIPGYFVDNSTIILHHMINPEIIKFLKNKNINVFL